VTSGVKAMAKKRHFARACLFEAADSSSSWEVAECLLY
jgi:hypothetical protein